MKSDIVSFEFVRINRARGKICKCNPPHYESRYHQQDSYLQRLRSGY